MKNWQNANGVFGKIRSVFTPANAISKNDIEAIKAYNSQIDSCATLQTAFNRIMLNASPAAQNLAASYNGYYQAAWFFKEYADGYSNLFTEQQVFVKDFLKSFNSRTLKRKYLILRMN